MEASWAQQASKNGSKKPHVGSGPVFNLPKTRASRGRGVQPRKSGPIRFMLGQALFSTSQQQGFSTTSRPKTKMKSMRALHARLPKNPGAAVVSPLGLCDPPPPSNGRVERRAKPRGQVFGLNLLSPGPSAMPPTPRVSRNFRSCFAFNFGLKI